ncbi:hypothetical protein HCCG_00348 [Helicobacter cinaedi CCUG 18818 = ATCC BAA-847]|uniref:Uncharacterized protein n=1 Tax=Helicobacter cinaedi CCUG 18818 = ATCC BAA-847 TaxID=537971 RepID=A0ABN0B8E6_9HELI|nr:hypothetical protein HCCG_00348 [Helicobacter cinaedi CCUG 18818 = ATCC BAA-847]
MGRGEAKSPKHSRGSEASKGLRGNSSLGSHSGDFVHFRGTADSMSSSPLKCTKSPTSTTANTRIVDSSIAESYANSMFFVILSL